MREQSYTADNKGERHNAGKPRLGLLPPDALLALGMVYEKGAEKYAPRNWERGMNYSNVIDSLLRHTLAWMTGEDKDAESGEQHMAHVAWNALALVTYNLRHIGVDDRHKLVAVGRSMQEQLDEALNLPSSEARMAELDRALEGNSKYRNMRMGWKPTTDGVHGDPEKSDMAQKLARAGLTGEALKEAALACDLDDTIFRGKEIYDDRVRMDGQDYFFPKGWEYAVKHGDRLYEVGDTVLLRDGAVHLVGKIDTTGNVLTVVRWSDSLADPHALIHARAVLCHVKQVKAKSRHRCQNCPSDALPNDELCEECKIGL